MAGETLSVLDGLLKDVYQDIITEQVGTFSAVQQSFEKITDAQWEGRYAIEGTVMSLNEGVGAIGEDANLPTAGYFDPQQFKIPMKYVYGSFQMTKPMMAAAETSKGAFKNATRYSMESMVRNLKRERARMLWGAGTGILAYTNTSGAVTTLAVDTPGGVTGTLGARYLRKNMIIACINPGDGTLRSGTVTTISGIAATGLSATIPSTTITENDYVVRANTATETAAAGTSYNKEPMGILGLIDNATYLETLHNLSRTTYPQLKSRVHSSVGALTLDAIQTNFDIASQQGDAEISSLAAHHSVRRAYLALLEADRRYSGGDLKAPDGGTKVVKRGSYVTFGDVPIIEDKYAPYGMIFGIDKNHMKRYVNIEGEWANESGAILRQVSGKDTWTAFYRIFENYHCSRPNTCFRMDGVTATAVYVADY
ncbi:MAG TPA: phage major capsid protein [Nitrospirota bacterium]|nr:phage major capsid protein [Nitrospirota bacterium]